MEADGAGNIDAAQPSPAPSQAAASDDRATSPAEQPTEVTVRFRLVCGGLTQARVPVAIAPRYDGLPLAAATRAFDGILDSWLNRAIDLGIIGSGLGQLFPIDVQSLYDEGRICARRLLLANMGVPGRFAADDLRLLMSNITVVVKSMGQDMFGTTLLGTRRHEMSVEDALRGFLEGIVDGHERFSAIASVVKIHRQQFVEAVNRPLTIVLVDSDKEKLGQIRSAIDLVREERSVARLQLLPVQDGGEVGKDPQQADDETTGDDTGPSVPTSLLRIMMKTPLKAAMDAGDDVVFQFAGLSDSAVVPIREQPVNPYLVREIPARISSSATDSAHREKLSMLFGDCVVPEDFRRVLADAQSITLEVDQDSAPYPWEMLAQSSYSKTLFIGTQVAVARQFRTDRAPVPSSPPPLNNKLRVLVIADPAGGPLSLPNARAEGKAVVDILDHARRAWRNTYDIKVAVRIGSRDDVDIQDYLEGLRKRTDFVESATTCEPLEIITQIVRGDQAVRGNYDVIHYAGHGFFDAKSGRAGWVLSDDCRLTASEIFRVRQVPRLVFANACFSTVVGDDDHNAQRAHVSSVAYAFFTLGIPNFIGAGWPVGDACAQHCARWFYAKALGLPRPDAVATDEESVTAPPATIGNALRVARRNMLKDFANASSWGAYQHYGRSTDKLLPFHNVDSDPNSRSSNGAATGDPAGAPAAPFVSFSTPTQIGRRTTMTAPDPNLVYANGIDLETGQYAVKPTSIDGLAKQVYARPGVKKFDAVHVDRPRSFALVFGVDLSKLDEAGWAVVFHEDTPPDVRAALEPLIAHRKSQAGARFRLLDYRKGEQIRDWYDRHSISAGNLDPEVVPFYLLLVGSPGLIPFEFQYLMGVEYAVGRLAFATAAEYERYARSVVDYEKAGAVPNAKQIAYWGTRHDNDPATNMSAESLVGPLANGLPGASGALKRPIHEQVGYDRQLCLADDATKERLLAALHAPKPPAFLFTASHGMQVPAGKPMQTAVQGALLCQDWNGFGSVKPKDFLAASDVADDARVHGLVAFLFACFGNGTPDLDQFPMDLSQAGDLPHLAPTPFIAALPQRLLTHPNGSALAVVGHIDRAWGFSIQAPKVAEPQIGAFRNTLGFILDGNPIGYALGGNFGARFASLSTALASATSPTAPPGTRPSDRDLVTLWLQRNDAQNYLLLGDPAARIRKEAFA